MPPAITSAERRLLPWAARSAVVAENQRLYIDNARRGDARAGDTRALTTSTTPTLSAAGEATTLERRSA